MMIPYSLEAECVLRIVLSSICGIMIGFERSKRLKEAGVRTHCMVAFGAALMMVVSKPIWRKGIYSCTGQGAPTRHASRLR